MSEEPLSIPRVILFRHGETDWSKTGRFTGTTNKDLTPDGIAQVTRLTTVVVGRGKLLDPGRVVHAFVSPMTRARKTFHLLLSAHEISTEYTADIMEWDYGEYEGLTDREIRDLRTKKGLDGDRRWSIWSDGCPGGESKEAITTRLDRLISRIKQMQQDRWREGKHADVVIVAHGLILRCFLKRWIKRPVDDDISLLWQAGGFAIVRYVSFITLADSAESVDSYKGRDLSETNWHAGVALSPEVSMS
ncbi:hypothetical protein PMIN06_011521 [Paraphaeosphaeria minitans]